MMYDEYAKNMIDYIYEEGERDYIFFGQLLGMVSYDFDDISLRKNDSERIGDAISLASYLIFSGGFNSGRTINCREGFFEYKFFLDGIDGLKREVILKFKQNGIDDIDLNYGIWLRKTNLGQEREGNLPDEVINLFRSSTFE